MHVVGLTDNSTMARVIAVASAKGGVGKTTTTAALGATLAETGTNVVAVDADLGMANLGTAVGVDVDGATVHDVLAGRADASDATYEGPAGLSVVPGETDLAAFPDADPSKLGTVLEAFDDADYVLLDTGAGLSHDTVLPLGLADEVVLVTDTAPNAVGDTEKTRQVVDRIGGSVAGVVVTQADPARTMGDNDAIDAVDAIGAPVLATVPASPVVAEAAAADEPLSVSEPTSAVAAAYRQLARELTDEQILERDVEDAETVTPDDVFDDGPIADGDDVAVDDSDESDADVDDSDEAVSAGDVPPEDDTESGGDTQDEDDVDALVPDAESDVSTAETATDVEETERADDGTDDTAAEDGVYTTPLVDEAESSGGSADPAADDETQMDEDDEEDDDDERSGFLGRLLG